MEGGREGREKRGGEKRGKGGRQTSKRLDDFPPHAPGRRVLQLERHLAQVPEVRSALHYAVLPKNKMIPPRIDISASSPGQTGKQRKKQRKNQSNEQERRAREEKECEEKAKNSLNTIIPLRPRLPLNALIPLPLSRAPAYIVRMVVPAKNNVRAVLFGYVAVRGRGGGGGRVG